MIDILKKGFNSVWTFRWEVFMIYIVHLISGLFLGIQASKSLSKSIGHSTIGRSLTNGYDSNVATDLMRHSGWDVSYLSLGFIVSLVLALLISIFIEGGVISNISNNQIGIKSLIGYGKQFIGQFILTSVYTFLAVIILCTLLWVPFLFYSGDPIQTFDTEKPFIIILIILGVISTIVIGCISAWSIKAKSLISRESPYPYRTSFHWICKNIIMILFFSSISILIFSLTVCFFTKAISLCNGEYMAAWVSVFLGQFMVYGMCKIRVWYYGGIISLE